MNTQREITKEITPEQAKEQGFEFFFTSSDEEICYPLSEVEDYIRDGDTCHPATTGDHLVLDGYSIVENECWDLHDDAYDLIHKEDLEEFDKACKKMTEACKSATQTYHIERSIVIVEKLTPTVSSK